MTGLRFGQKAWKADTWPEPFQVPRTQHWTLAGLHKGAQNV